MSLRHLVIWPVVVIPLSRAKRSLLVCPRIARKKQRTSSTEAGTVLFGSARGRGCDRKRRFNGDHYNRRLWRPGPPHEQRQWYEHVDCPGRHSGGRHITAVEQVVPGKEPDPWAARWPRPHLRVHLLSQTADRTAHFNTGDLFQYSISHSGCCRGDSRVCQSSS
jgi:hypothetical protein